MSGQKIITGLEEALAYLTPHPQTMAQAA